MDGDWRELRQTNSEAPLWGNRRHANFCKSDEQMRDVQSALESGPILSVLTTSSSIQSA
jgi:hypothetical protein